MVQEYESPLKAYISRDKKGMARELFYVGERFTSEASTAQMASKEYLEKYGEIFSIKREELKNLQQTPEKNPTNAGIEYRFFIEKTMFDTKTLGFYQTYFGLPVWEAGIAVHMKASPFQVLSSQSSLHPHLKVTKPKEDSIKRLKDITADILAGQLGVLDRKQGDYNSKSLVIKNQQLIIYRYEKLKRQKAGEINNDIKNSKREPLTSNHLNLPLPEIPDDIKEGGHYVCAEVHFVLNTRHYGNIHWVAILEANTLSVLMVRALVDNVDGLVFEKDPITGLLPNAPLNS